MLQGWSLLAAIAGGAWLLSKTHPAAAPGTHYLGPPVQAPPFQATPVQATPPAPDPAGRIDVGRWGPGAITPAPAPADPGVYAWGHDGAGNRVRVPMHAGIVHVDAPQERPVGAAPAGFAWGHDAAGHAIAVPLHSAESGAAPASAGYGWAPTSDPGNAAHATSRALLPRGVSGAELAIAAATNARPDQLRRIPDTAGPPSVGDGWAPSRGSGRGTMPWDASHVPIVQAIAPRPAPLPTLPAPALGPGRGTGRHVPPPPPVAADPVGPTRTTLIPWDHPIAGPRMPELTGTKVPVTDAPIGASAWYGLPALGGGGLSSAAGPDIGVAKPPTLLSTIVQLLGRPAAAAAPARVVGGQLPRSGAPW